MPRLSGTERAGSSRPGRILVVRTDRIGDVVLATPLIRALRERFPTAFLAAMVRPYAAEILVGNPHLDEVVLDDPAGADRGTAGFWRQVARLRRYRFDTALLLLPTRRLATLLLLAGIRTRIGVGTRLYQVLTFMRSVSRNKYVPLRHEADYCLDLGRAIGVEADDLTTELFLSEAERRDGAAVLEAGGAAPGDALVGIHAGSGASAPNWRVEHYVELARRLLERADVTVVLTGSENERSFGSAFRALESTRVIDLIGKLSLREAMGVISRINVLVSASTGPMHLAAALGIPTVSMFCPLTACSPELWGPRGNRAEIVLPSDGFCQDRCPGDPHVCRFEGGIATTTVFERVMDLLESRSAA
jgi:heptosyltransferase-2